MARADVVVYGAGYSVYTRILRLTLAEKGVDYRLEEIDIFAPEGPPVGYAERHPFSRIPAFEHDGFRLFETQAITRYVDEAFPGPPLQRPDARDRARMNQTIAVMDAYGFRTLVWDVFVERVRAPEQGRAPDQRRIASALPRAEAILRMLAEMKGSAPWITGDRPTLADLHVLPMLTLFRLAPEGRELLTALPTLTEWLETMTDRPAARSTRFPIEDHDGDEHADGTVDSR